MNVKMKRTFLASFLVAVLTACAIFGAMAFKTVESPAVTESLDVKSLWIALRKNYVILTSPSLPSLMGSLSMQSLR